MPQVTLRFEGSNAPQLVELRFSHPLLEKERCVVRGKESRAHRADGSFQWTAGVKALSLFFVRAALARYGFYVSRPLLQGDEGSAAASLDYAICRGALWLLDMFGTDLNGGTVLRRLILITNSCRKHPGPVALSLRTPADKISIKIILNNTALDAPEAWQKLDQLLSKMWPEEKARIGLAEPVKETGFNKSQYTQLEVPKDPQTLLHELGFTRYEFSAVLEREILRSLRITEIFNRQLVRDDQEVLAKRVRQYTAKGNLSSVVSNIDNDVMVHNRFGQRSNEVELTEFLKELGDLTCYVTPSDIALLCILKHLSTKRGLNLRYNIVSYHYAALLRAAKSSCSTPHCLSTSVFAFGDCLASGYLPFMLAPQVSHYLLGSEKSDGDVYTDPIAFNLTLPGTGQVFFDEMVESCGLSKAKLKLTSLAPDEITCSFTQPETKLKAVMAFPYHNINSKFNKCRYLSTDCRLTPSNVIFLMLDNSFASKPRYVEALNIMIRKSWLELRENRTELNQIIEQLINDESYLRSWLRFSGSHYITTPTAPKEKLLQSIAA